MLYRVNRLDTFEDILYRVVDGVLARLDSKALVTHILQCDDLVADLVLRELLAGNFLVLHMVGTVNALVHAVIREIQRREHNDSVAVESLLYLLSERVYLLGHLGNIAREKYACLAVGESRALDSSARFLRASLLEYLLDESPVVLVLLRVLEGLEYFLVVDEFVCL